MYQLENNSLNSKPKESQEKGSDFSNRGLIFRVWEDELNRKIPPLEAAARKQECEMVHIKEKRKTGPEEDTGFCPQCFSQKDKMNRFLVE